MAQSYHYPGTLVHLYECSGDDQFTRVWHADTLFTPSLNSVATGDSDLDGQREIVAGEVGTLGRVYLWEVVDNDLLEQRPLDFDMNSYDGAIRDVRICDGDADGRFEIVVTTGDAGDGGAVGIFEQTGVPGENSYVQIQVYETVSYMLGTSCGDSDNDGHGEFVLKVGGGGGSFPLNLRRLEYNPGTGLYEHKLTQPGPLGLPLTSTVADLDGDGLMELAVGGAGPSGGFVHILEATADDIYGLTWSNGFYIDGNVMDVSVGSDDPWGYPTLVSSSFGGQVDLIGFDGTTYVRLEETPVAAGGPARSGRLVPLDQPDALDELVVAVSGVDQVRVFERNAAGVVPGPTAASLLSAYPNPFSRALRIAMSSLSLGVERPVRLSLHDARGRLIWTASLGPGHETVPPHLIWNGMDLTGRAVGSGTYFLRLEGGGSDVGLRIVRLR